jgi:CRP-like cAMP-binding protein
MSDDLRKLKDEAAANAEKGRYRKAAELYLLVSQREKDDPQWPHRVGEALRRAGAPAEGLPHLIVAATGYARLGFLLKAIAVAKMILQIDPKHAATQEMLVRLYAKQGGVPGTATKPPPPKPPAPPAPLLATPKAIVPPPPPPVEKEKEEEIPLLTIDDVLPAGPDAPLPPPSRKGPPPIPLAPGAPMESIPLAQVIPGATQSSEFKLPAYEIPVEEEMAIELVEPRTLPPIPLFSSLKPEQLRKIIDKVKTIERAPGEVVVREGERDDALYVLVRGEVEVTVGDKLVGTLGEGDFFGEASVISNQPRAATVKAAEPTELLEIDREVLGALVREDPEVLKTLLRLFRDRLIKLLVTTSPMFESFTPEEGEALAKRFRFLELEKGTTPIRQGERAGGLLVLLAGTCEVVQDGKPIANIGTGDIAGELSLLSAGTAMATVRATTKVWALGLSRAQFQELIVTNPHVLIYVNDVAERRRQGAQKLHMV